ncbi:hypothetical protein ACFQWF_11720 [Methylorubrum suomiense]
MHGDPAPRPMRMTTSEEQLGRRQEPCGPARTAKASFAEVVLVCGKCAKRQGVDRKRLGRALKRVLKRAPSSHATAEIDGTLRKAETRKTKARKVKIVETGCLGPCPKRLLTVATAASLARGRVVLLEPALKELSQALRLDAPARPVPIVHAADG